MKQFFKKHWTAILLAILVGLVCVLPQLFLIYDSGRDYQGIAMAGTDAEEYYNIRVREAYDGHLKLSSPDLWEYKNKPYVQPPLPEITTAMIAKTFGITPRQAVTLGKFLFPFILYLILYSLTFSLTKRKIIALAIPTAMMLATNFIFYPTDIIKLLTFKWSQLQVMVDYTRPVNPQFSSLVFWAWLLLFYRWLTTRRHIFYFSSIILLGSLFYVYPYSWTLACGLVGFLFIISLFNKKTGLKLPVLKLLIALGLPFVIALPYWINYYHSIKDPLYAVLQQRYGFYASHQPLWSNFLFLDIVILLFFYFKRRKDLFFYIFLGIFLSLFVLINQQVVTGLRIYPGHWHWYYTAPFTIFLVFWFVFNLMRRKNKLSRFIIPVAILVILASFLNAAVKQRNAYLGVRENFINAQKFASVFDWLNQNTVKDDVVLTDGDLNVKLAVYTHNNSYFSRWGEFYAIPHERFKDRYLARAYLNGINQANVDNYVTAVNKDVYELLFGRYRVRRGLCGNGCFSAEELNELKQIYLDFVSQVDFEDFLKKYRLDYAVWDTHNNPDWNLDDYSFMEFMTEINGARIYKITS